MSFMVATSVIAGIVLAADSRGILTIEKEDIAYTDVFEKVYPLKDRPIGIARIGPSWIKKAMIPRILGEFESDLSGDETVKEVAEKLNDYFLNTVPHPNPPQEMNFFVVAGYDSGLPGMWGCAPCAGQLIGTPTYGFIRSSDPDFRPLRRCSDLDLDEAIDFAKGSIEAYSKRGFNWLGTGGPTDILVIMTVRTI